jgi:hypothetical protein
MYLVHDVPNWTLIMLGTPFKLQLAHNPPIKKMVIVNIPFQIAHNP